MLAPTRFVARLDEPAIAGDRTSSQKSEQLPTYNAYSADGDVTGELVYVNYGVPADYDELALRGVDVKGKVVIARYGGSWRGIKPKVAAERGAVGCIIYSDPGDDGYAQGDPYPRGGYRPDARRAARVGHGHARAQRRPADPGRGGDPRRPATRARGRADAHAHPRAADLGRRRAAAAGRPRRADGPRELARRACPSPTAWDRGPRASA